MPRKDVVLYQHARVEVNNRDVKAFLAGKPIPVLAELHVLARGDLQLVVGLELIRENVVELNVRIECRCKVVTRRVKGDAQDLIDHRLTDFQV